MKRYTPLLAIVGLAVVAWGLLFWSGNALLVWSTGPDNGRAIGTLKCTYFSGGGFVKREFLYSKQGFLGRDTCPRSIELDHAALP